MIIDSQTNMVYLAEGLSYYEEAYRNLLYALNREHIHTETLSRTKSHKHVWVRDFMPIQLDKNSFLLYKYQPDYLEDDEDYIPNYKAIVRNLKLEHKTTSIIIDGGNVVKCGDKVIMTDKIFCDNIWLNDFALIAELEELMEAQLVIIPWDRFEIFGHADGMVRYISGNRVLLNNYVNFDLWLRDDLFEVLSSHFTVEQLEFHTPKCNKLSWAYLNFLQTKNCIFVPGLHAKEDPLAVKQIQMYYPDYKVIQIQGCEHLAKDGGALNCISWNILADMPEWPKEES